MPHNIISFFNTFQKGWGQTHVKKSYKFIKAFWQKIALKLTQKHIKSEKSDILILKCTEGVEVANLGLGPIFFLFPYFCFIVRVVCLQ